MAKQPEQTGKAPDSKPGDGSAAPSRADLIRIQLKHAAHYISTGFAPVVSAIALALALVAIVGNQTAQERLGKTTAKLESISAAQPASKAELEKLKTAMTQEKTLRDEELKKRDEQLKALEEERKKQDELLAKIVQNVSKLQVKAKITPTLEQQLRQAASAPAATTTPTAQAAAPAAPPKPVEKKFSPQVQSMKEAIEQYNKN